MIRALRLVPRVIGRGHRGHVEALRIVETPFVSHAMVDMGGRSLGADGAREIVAPQLPCGSAAQCGKVARVCASRGATHS